MTTIIHLNSLPFGFSVSEWVNWIVRRRPRTWTSIPPAPTPCCVSPWSASTGSQLQKLQVRVTVVCFNGPRYCNSRNGSVVEHSPSELNVFCLIPWPHHTKSDKKDYRYFLAEDLAYKDKTGYSNLVEKIRWTPSGKKVESDKYFNFPQYWLH